MLTVKIKGGLGNQLFQYAFGYCLSMKREVPLYLDLIDFDNPGTRNFELDIFPLNMHFLTPELRRKKSPGRLKKLFLPRKSFSIFSEEISTFVDHQSLEDYDYFDGYWQSWKYFDAFKENLRSSLNFPKIKNKVTQQYLSQVRSCLSVSLHIRRGDYITDAAAVEVLGLCPLQYYEDALSHLRQKIPEFEVFVFSDDLPWAKTNFVIQEKVHFIDLGNEGQDWEEMFLMSNCSHNIIANSSFSWWSAWLNTNNSKIVVSPKKWFKAKDKSCSDLIPPDWVQV